MHDLPVCFQDKIALDAELAKLTSGKVIDFAQAVPVVLRRMTARYRCQALIRRQRGNGGSAGSGGTLVRANG